MIELFIIAVIDNELCGQGTSITVPPGYELTVAMQIELHARITPAAH